MQFEIYRLAARNLWETVGMAKHTIRVPKIGDRVSTPKIKDVFLVLEVRENPSVVNLRLLKGTLLLREIPWTMLTFLDAPGDAGQGSRT